MNLGGLQSKSFFSPHSITARTGMGMTQGPTGFQAGQKKTSAFPTFGIRSLSVARPVSNGAVGHQIMAQSRNSLANNKNLRTVQLSPITSAKVNITADMKEANLSPPLTSHKTSGADDTILNHFKSLKLA